jgi:hypothetical protein
MVEKALLNLFRINQDFDRQGIFLNLAGPLSQSLMVEMGGLMKTKMALEGSDANTIKKAFSVLVELNQNIIHYSAETGQVTTAGKIGCIEGCGIISVGRSKNSYFLLSGNLVENHKVEFLIQKLDRIREMTHKELKEEYHLRRKKGPDQDSKGAGLGLIEIARKAVLPLEFRFDRIDDRFSFFSLKTVI